MKVIRFDPNRVTRVVDPKDKALVDREVEKVLKADLKECLKVARRAYRLLLRFSKVTALKVIKSNIDHSRNMKVDLKERHRTACMALTNINVQLFKIVMARSEAGVEDLIHPADITLALVSLFERRRN